MSKKLTAALLLCALFAGLLAVFSSYRQLYYFLFVVVAGAVIFIVKQGEITVYDWLVLFICTIPFHALRIGGQTHFVRLSEIAFIPFVLWYLAGRIKRPTPFKIRREFFWIIAFLVINILSISKSLHPLVSAKRVLIIGYLILFAYLVSDTIKTTERELSIIKAMIAVSALSATLAVLQTFIPQLHVVPIKELVAVGKVTLYRASAGWIDPNYYALYLAMNAALSLSFILSPRIKTTPFLRICLLLQLAGLVATFSRMGAICLAGAFIYLLFSYGRKKAALAIIILILLSLIAVVVSVEQIYEEHPVVQAYIFRQPDLEALQEYPRLILVHRWDAFRANWRMFLDNPLLGVGPFMAMDNYAQYKPEDALWYTRQMLDSHNQYLQLLAEKGIFGLLFFMGFIVLIWRRLSRCVKQPAATETGAILLGLKAGLVAYLIACLAAQATHELQFWLTLGLALALLNILERPSNVES